MELWIRSQDKKGLFKIDNVGINDYNGYFYVVSIIKGEEVKLGKYEFHNSTRALEVLNEIQNILNPMLIFKNCNCTKDVLDNIKEVGACVVSDNAHIEQVQTCIYEMPEN